MFDNLSGFAMGIIVFGVVIVIGAGEFLKFNEYIFLKTVFLEKIRLNKLNLKYF